MRAVRAIYDVDCSMKQIICASLLLLALSATPNLAFCRDRYWKLVTRIETVSVAKRGRAIVIRVEGKATAPGLSAGPARLVRRDSNPQPNREGLLEYDLNYDAPRDYAGFKLRTVRASLKDSSVPADTKGVRVFAEFNHFDALLPSPKRKK
jgi:hypothetical protein